MTRQATDLAGGDGTWDSASATVARLASRQVSALELCDAAIGRIEAADGALNAVVVRDFDRARTKARARDAALARGERGALLGLPMTVKEAFDVQGLPTSWGLAQFRGRTAGRDAVLVARLEAAGAVILGKTNVAAGLADWQSENPVYGRTLHPLDAARTPGGSSGGSAAALAAGFVALELGSDIGGSIRVPAHFCGLFGHKPSFGLLPTRGHDFPGTDGAPVELAVAGPMARTADDLALALSVLAGPNEHDAAGWLLALPAPRTSLAGCRVLLLREHPCCRTDAELRDALAALGRRLAIAGAQVKETSALMPDLEAAHATYVGMLEAVTTRGDPEAGPPISAHAWMALLDEQARIRRRWSALFETQFDIVLMPPFGTTAFEHFTEPDVDRRLLSIDGRPRPYGEQLAWPAVATLPGLPATVAPIARDAAGWPIGVQVMGPYLGDRTTIALAGRIAEL
jgi:amidase